MSPLLLVSPSPARADIFQWEYIDPADPTQGRRQSTTLAPDGAGVHAMPAATLNGLNLTKAYLIGADLSPIHYCFFDACRTFISHLNNTNLTDADLSQANLTSADFSFATLAGAEFTSASVHGANFYSTTASGFSAAQLYSTVSYQAHDLSGIRLGSNDLNGWNFAGQKLSNADFYRATLTDVDFSDAWVQGAHLYRSTAYGFAAAQLYSTASYQAHDLSGIGLASNNLAGWNFAGQNLSNATLIDATLTGANFREANLTNVDFGAATMGGTDFTSADMRGGDYSFNIFGAIRTNLIGPNGSIFGLDLNAGSRLVVRDYDGNATGYPYLTGPIPITIDQHLTMAPGGTLRMVFEADAWDSTISFAPGIPVTRGGTLELTFAADVNLASQVGRTLELFDWTGVTPTGAFTIASPYAWDTSNLYTTGEVTLTAIPEPATFVLGAVTLLSGFPAVRRVRRLANRRLRNIGDCVDKVGELAGVSDQHETLNHCPHRLASARDDDSGRPAASGQMVAQMDEHRMTIFGDQNASFALGPQEHGRVESRQRHRSMNLDFWLGRLPLGQAGTQRTHVNPLRPLLLLVGRTRARGHVVSTSDS